MAGKRRISDGAIFLGAVMGIVAAVVAGVNYLIPDGPKDASQQTTDVAAADKPVVEGPAEQASASLYRESDGIKYSIWEGTVIEELNNNEAGDSFKTGFDQNIYNFDLGVVLHVTSEDAPSMVRTLFSELAVDGKPSPHIERVRAIGCSLVKDFEGYAASGKYGAPPADVTAFGKRHCAAPAGP